MEPINEPELQGLINDSNKNGNILSESSLRALSRSLAVVISRDVNEVDETGLEHIRSLQDDLLRTASSSELSLVHGAAALNCLCGYLEQCSISSDPAISALPFAYASWAKVLNIYLTRAEKNKPKPVRGLLVTLTGLLSRHPVQDVKLSLMVHAVDIATRLIRQPNEAGSIKAAIQLLEHFLATDIVHASHIVQIATAQEPQQNQPFSANRVVDDSQHANTIQDFTISVLGWVQYPDCAPAIGRFLPAFFRSIECYQKPEAAQELSHVTLPLWISPVKQCLERHRSLLETYENHVLPGLLRISLADRQAFIGTLPLHDIQQGDPGNHTVADIELCILVARIESSSKVENPKTSRDNAAVGIVSAPIGIGEQAAVKGNVQIDAERLAMNLLEHPVSVVRMASFSILVSSSGSKRLLSKDVFQCLQRCIPSFHVEVNAKARNEFIALMKNLCSSLRSASLLLMREHESSMHIESQAQSSPQADPRTRKLQNLKFPLPLQENSHFQIWYTQFLALELQPTASYQSHITALRILHSFLVDWESLIRNPPKASQQYLCLLERWLPSGLLLRPLLDLMLDPFDDVRHAANILVLSYLTIEEITPSPRNHVRPESGERECGNGSSTPDISKEIQVALTKAEHRAAATGRADHADGVSRLYALLYNLDNASSLLDDLTTQLAKEVEFAKKDLHLAVQGASLHGHLIALRHIASRPNYWPALKHSTPDGNASWMDFNERIMSICGGIWEAVRVVLCFDAPEGTDAIEDEQEDADVGAKDTLSYCWRALKESSTLMHVVVTSGAYSPSLSDNHSNLKRFGWLALTQLKEIRHRGAFSTVSLTFAACCTACARSGNTGLIQEQKSWYQEALKAMFDNASMLTRRSAGLPAIITGILAAYPTGSFFDNVVLDLEAIADGPVSSGTQPADASLPQVHALNCLKDIFTDARFGPSTERHIPFAMDIAASCLESQVWAIRNCGLMLFKSLLRRLNGGTDTSSTKVSSSFRRSSKAVFDKCPNLPDLMLRLLDSNIPTHTANSKPSVRETTSPATMKMQSVFAALELTERVGLPPGHESEVLDTLWYYAGCSDWSLREKAAKTLSLVIDKCDLESQAMNLLSPDRRSHNVLHGRLLFLRFILGRARTPLFGSELNMRERLLLLLEKHLDRYVIHSECPFTAAAFLDCLAELIVILIRSQSRATIAALSSLTQLLENSTTACGKVSQASFALRSRAEARIFLLNILVKDSQLNDEQDNILDKQFNLSERKIEAITAIDESCQLVSDEKMLATLSQTSIHELRAGAENMQITDRDFIESIRLSNDPREADYALALSGYSFGSKHAFEEHEKEELLDWIRMLQLAGSEDSEVRTRSAAAFSVRAFFDVLSDKKVKPKLNGEMLDVYLLLYDMLIDDDEDVRNQGATTVSSLLSTIDHNAMGDSASNFSLSPPAAKYRFLEFMHKGYHKSSDMFARVTERLLGSQQLATSHGKDCGSNASWVARLRPVSEILHEAQKPDLAVFAEEKQNLYINMAKESEIWADILLTLDPNDCVVEVAETLEKWTMDGLSHFLDILSLDEDSTFGPTSIPEIFTLWKRVLLSAKVTLARSSSTSDRPSPCRSLLEELRKVGKDKNLHSLLMDDIEQILKMT